MSSSAYLQAPTCSVLLADDHYLLRQSLKLLLLSSPDIAVVGEAQTGLETLEQVLLLRPHIVVLDITLPDLNGLEVCKKIRERTPQTKVLILTMHESEAYFLQALQAGALGYLLKKAAPQELYQALRALQRGHVFVSHELLTGLVHASLEEKEVLSLPQIPHAEPIDLFALLTPRERQILQYIMQGRTCRQIGHLLHISVKTAQAHRNNVMEKLKVHNVSQLVKLALRSGCFPLTDES
jgi:DNA-binding NarL/FixJ family response regulator